MSDAAIYTVLTAIFHDVFMRDDIGLKPETTASDVAGWDSFKQIEILLALEGHYGIKFTTKDINKVQCVADLVAIVARRTGG